MEALNRLIQEQIANSKGHEQSSASKPQMISKHTQTSSDFSKIQQLEKALEIERAKRSRVREELFLEKAKTATLREDKANLYQDVLQLQAEKGDLSRQLDNKKKVRKTDNNF